MVDLPIPDQQPVFATDPQERVSGRQYAQSGSYLAEGLQKLSDGLEAVAIPLAKQQASADLAKMTVSRDANGQVIVGQPPGIAPIFG